MAAYKAGCDTVIIPLENKKDLAEISEEVKAAITFVTVSSFEELMPTAYEYLPKPTETETTYNTLNQPVIDSRPTA